MLAGIIVAEAMRYTSIAGLLERSCRGRPRLAIPMAAVLGMASPLCTYGTVPLVRHFLRSGVPLAPLATFLSTSSLMNPQLLILTWGGLGPRIAGAQLTAVLVFGLLLGGALHVLPSHLVVRQGLREPHQHHHRSHPRVFGWRTFTRDCLRTLEFIGLYVVTGALLGAAIEELIPGRLIVSVFGGGGWTRILLAAVLGVPLYACGGGTIPLLRVLLHQGMMGGAAVAFLIAGPATRVTPLAALATIVRPRWLIGYVLIVVAFSVAVGLVYGLV